MHRIVTFPPNGHRIHASPAAVAATWEAQYTRIPPQFAVASAEQESGHTINEIDEEPPDEHGISYISKGIFQLSDGEAAHVGHASADLLTLEGASLVFALLQEERLAILLSAAGLDAPTPDIYGFLSVAHNQGVGAARETIIKHGASWSAYKSRNISAAEAAVAVATPETIEHARTKLAWWHSVAAYGDDCITGGARWPEALAAV